MNLKKKEKTKKEKKLHKENETSKDLVKVKNKKSANEVLKKWLAKTSLTVLLIAIIIVAYIGLNYFVEKAKLTDIDLTKEKVYSLSDTSKDFLKGIEQDVEIILINMDKVAQSVIDFSYQYSKANDKIKVKEVEDVSQEPELTSEYSLTDETYLIIIKSGEKEKVLTTSSLYTYDYTTGEQKDTTEEAITNAILDVTVTEKPKIYYLSNHMRYAADYMYFFFEDLTSEANEVEALDLLTKGKVPDDASVLVITTLSEDITGPEKDAIIKYIKNGGKLAIFSDANVGNLKLTNFQKVLDQYGVGISTGIMLEQDANKMLAGSPSAILPSVNQSSSIMSETDMSVSACFMNAGKLTFKDDEDLEKLGVEVETLMTTSSTSFYRSDLSIQSISKQDKDEEGSQTVGALITKTLDEDKTSKLIIFSNNMFITNVSIEVYEGSYLYALDFYHNEDIALNSIAYLTGREDFVTIRKATETTSYTVTEKEQNVILTIIFVVPAVIVVIGIVVWQARRRKK